MNIKIKMFKKLISVLCVATISTSCVAPSVGAFKKAVNAKGDVVNSVNDANQFLDLFKDRINKMLQKIGGESEKYINNMNEDDQIKLAEVLSCLEMSKQRVNEFDVIVIDDLKLAENITDKLCNVLYDDRYSEVNIGNFNEYKNLLEKYSGLAVDISMVLDNIKSMIEEHKQQQAEKERLERERKEKEDNIINEFNKIVPEFIKINREFRSWRDSEENKGKVVEDPKVRSKRLEAIALYTKKLCNKFDAKKAEQFIQVAKEAIDMMDKFKTDYEKKKATKNNNFANKIQAIWRGHAFREKQERLEKERLEQERLEKERLEKERLEKERLEKEKKEKEEKERLENNNLYKLKLDLQKKRAEYEARKQQHYNFIKLFGNRLLDTTFSFRTYAVACYNNACKNTNEENIVRAINGFNNAIRQMNVFYDFYKNKDPKMDWNKIWNNFSLITNLVKDNRFEVDFNKLSKRTLTLLQYSSTSEIESKVKRNFISNKLEFFKRRNKFNVNDMMNILIGEFNVSSDEFFNEASVDIDGLVEEAKQRVPRVSAGLEACKYEFKKIHPGLQSSSNCFLFAAQTALNHHMVKNGGKAIQKGKNDQLQKIGGVWRDVVEAEFIKHGGDSRELRNGGSYEDTIMNYLQACGVSSVAWRLSSQSFSANKNQLMRKMAKLALFKHFQKTDSPVIINLPNHWISIVKIDAERNQALVIDSLYENPRVEKLDDLIDSMQRSSSNRWNSPKITMIFTKRSNNPKTTTIDDVACGDKGLTCWQFFKSKQLYSVINADA